MILKTKLQFGCISSTLITKWNFKILHFETLANIIYKSIYSFYCISSTIVPSLLVACALAVSHGMQGVGISISNMISWISRNFVLHWIVRWRFGALDSSSSCRWAEAYRFQKKSSFGERIRNGVGDGRSVSPSGGRFGERHVCHLHYFIL